MVFDPSVRKQGCKFKGRGLFIVRHIGYDIVEISPGVDIVVTAGSQQRLHHAHILGCLVIATEQIVLPAKRYRADFIHGQIVVKPYAAVFKVAHHVGPPVIGIGDSLADQRLRTVKDTFGVLQLMLTLIQGPDQGEVTSAK